MGKEDDLEQSVMMPRYKNIIMKSLTLCVNLKYLSGAGEMAQRVDALAMPTQ